MINRSNGELNHDTRDGIPRSTSSEPKSRNAGDRVYFAVLRGPVSINGIEWRRPFPEAVGFGADDCGVLSTALQGSAAERVSALWIGGAAGDLYGDDCEPAAVSRSEGGRSDDCAVRRICGGICYRMRFDCDVGDDASWSCRECAADAGVVLPGLWAGWNGVRCAAGAAAGGGLSDRAAVPVDTEVDRGAGTGCGGVWRAQLVQSGVRARAVLHSADAVSGVRMDDRGWICFAGGVAERRGSGLKTFGMTVTGACIEQAPAMRLLALFAG